VKNTTKWDLCQIKNFTPADPGHPYLQTRGINALGLLQNGKNLIVPAAGPDGQVKGCQVIKPSGQTHISGQIDGCYFIVGEEGMARLGNQTRKPELFVCANLADAEALYQATGQPAYVAFTSENLEAVSRIAGKRNPGARVILDRDLPMDKGMDAVKKVLEPNADATNQWNTPVNIAKMISIQPEPLPWLFTLRIPAGRGVVLTGLGGSSKTTVLYAMAVGACCGSLPWSWEIERTGKAVLVLTEDTTHDVHYTVHYLSRGLTDEQKEAISKNLIIYPLAGKDTRLMVKTGNGTVEKSPLYHSLKEKVTSLGSVVFVGLDPALSISEGDENDQAHQRVLGKMADDLGVNTGAAVVLVSHSTKGSLQTEEPQSHSSRGGGAITDATRGEYVLRNMTGKEAIKANITETEERHRHVQLVCTKGNKIPPGARVPVWLRRDDFGNLSEVYIEMDGKGTLTDRDIEILKVHSKIGVFGTPKLADWRNECIKLGMITGATENAQKQAMKRVLDKLLKAGLIVKGIGRGIYTQTDQTKEPPF
jgi:hypothetical protein